MWLYIIINNDESQLNALQESKPIEFLQKSHFNEKLLE
jgi:hypothetical protein